MAAIFREWAEAFARGLAQLVLADGVPAGLLVVVGLALISPWGAAGALAGAAFGTALGRLVPSCSRDDWDHGIAGFNCAIVGLFWAGHLARGDVDPLLILALFAVCVAVEIGLRRGLAPFRLPALSLPAVVTLLAASLVLAPSGTWFWIDTPASSFGSTGIIVALICLAAAMATKSVAAAAFSVVLAVSCYLVVKVLGRDAAAYAGLWALNIPLAAFALSGVFRRDMALGFAAGGLAAAVAAILWLIWTASDVAVVAPPLLAPYVLGVWCALAGARRAGGWPVFLPGFWRAVWALRTARAEGRGALALVGGDRTAHRHALQNLGGVRDDGDPAAALATTERLRASSRWRRAFWQACADWREAAREGTATERHALLADMERRGILAAIVTQDGGASTRAAGAREVIDLHGPIDEVACLDCDSILPWPPGRLWRQIDLQCTACGGQIVPRGGVLRAEVGAATLEVLDSRLADCAVLLVPGGLIPHPAVDLLFDRLRAVGGRAVFLHDGRMPRTPGPGDIVLAGRPARILRALAATIGAINWVSARRSESAAVAPNAGGSAP